MEIVVKRFRELTTIELYQILQLRSQVFVVEQNCVYQDIDDKDGIAYHVMGYLENELVAYTRFFNAGDYFDYASFGRVVVKESARSLGIGKKIVEATIEFMNKTSQGIEIAISAQTYLERFYRDFDFKPVGKQYLEDGIPHIKMVRKAKS